MRLIVYLIFSSLLILISCFCYFVILQSFNEFTHTNTDVYLMNMSRNQDRLDHFKKMFKYSDLVACRFFKLDAIDGREVQDLKSIVSKQALGELKQIQKTGARTKHYQISKGAIGCYLSHLMIYKHMLKHDKQYALVFEDDVVFKRNIFERTKLLLKNAPNDWDVILLGCHCLECSSHDNQYNKVNKFFWTHSMLFNRSGLKKIVHYLSNILIEQQIDAALGDLAMQGKINIYCVKTPIAKQTQRFETTIQLPLRKQFGVDPFSRVHEFV